jgi:hypothetical protein
MIGEAIRRIHNNESVNSIFTAWCKIKKLRYNSENYLIKRKNNEKNFIINSCLCNNDVSCKL